jgi:hypothetical protein
VREELAHGGGNGLTQLKRAIELTAAQVDVCLVLGGMIIPIDEDECLQRSVALPGIPVSLGEVVGAEQLDQTGDFGAEPLRFRH